MMNFSFFIIISADMTQEDCIVFLHDTKRQTLPRVVWTADWSQWTKHPVWIHVNEFLRNLRLIPFSSKAESLAHIADK